MPTAFIDDGYTEEATLAEVAGIFDAIKFTFRPMTTAEMSEFGQKVAKLTGIEFTKETAKRMASKIVDWDVRNPKGELIEIKADNIERLKEPAFIGLWRIIQCDKAGGADAKN